MVTPLYVFVVLRSTQQHSELIGLYDTEAHAEQKAASYNRQYSRGARAKVTKMMVRSGSEES